MPAKNIGYKKVHTVVRIENNGCKFKSDGRERTDHNDQTAHPSGGDGEDPSGGADQRKGGGQAHVDAVRKPTVALVLVQEPPVGKNGKVRAEGWSVWLLKTTAEQQY